MMPVVDALKGCLIERDAEAEALTLGMISREHVLLVGPPGTAKSYMCRLLAQVTEGCRFAERLLSPTTPPEAVFGPPDLEALKNGEYKHVGTGTVTDAEIVQLEEFFRGSDAIRDSLLHLLGPERQALVGTQQVKVPMRFCVGTSNSWSESADQQAILDRWTIRLTVKRLSRSGRRKLVRMPDNGHLEPVVTLEMMDEAHRVSLELPITDEALEALDRVLDDLEEAGICPSDRRVRSGLKVARAAAVLEGSPCVLPRHLEPLGMVLWDSPSQAENAATIVGKISNPIGAKINAILAAAAEVVALANDTEKRVGAIKKLRECKLELRQLAETGGNGRLADAVRYVDEQMVMVQAAVMGADVNMVREMAKAAGGGR